MNGIERNEKQVFDERGYFTSLEEALAEIGLQVPLEEHLADIDKRNANFEADINRRE